MKAQKYTIPSVSIRIMKIKLHSVEYSKDR